MGHITDIFKIILVLQLLASVLAFYGHPDAETIDFASPNQPSRDQLIIDAAIKRGMDGEAVAELLRTKKPVVKTTITPTGFNKTTTYKLEPDGSISSKSILQKRNHYVYNSGNIPDNIPIDDLRKSPTGTVTRTFTDSAGNKVTQTIAVGKPKPVTTLDEDDWFNKPFPSWPEETSPSSSVHRTITRTFTGPTGERRTVQSWSSEPEISEPETLSTRTSTRTYLQPNGDDFDIAKKPKFPKIGHANWPSIDFPSYDKAWDPIVSDDADDWEIEEEPELQTTTKKNLNSWTPRTWEWPEFPTQRTTTTTVKPKTTKQIERQPSLPSLDDFLKSQYETTTQRLPRPSTTTTRTTPAAPTTTTKPKIIKIEDLPVVEVLQNGNPADEALLKILPPHLTPRTQTEKVLKIEHKYPIEEDIEFYTPKTETNIRTYSKTHIGPEKPTLKDLEPQMQEILRKAGINPDEITNIEGNTITKTRKEPDGRTITTTYKVNTVPSPPVETVSAQHHYRPSPAQVSTHSFSSYKPLTPSLTPLQSITPYSSPISEFLAKLGLTKFDIASRNNHYTKTFIDDNGEVLTATFVLSYPKGPGNEEKPQIKPLK